MLKKVIKLRVKNTPEVVYVSIYLRYPNIQKAHDAKITSRVPEIIQRISIKIL